MTPDNFIKSQVVLLAWREAHAGGGVNNITAVMHVLRNRVNGGWMGGDWLKVIDGHALVAGNLETLGSLGRSLYPDLRHPDTREIINRVDDIFNGQAADDMTDGALYYARLDHPLTEWFKLNIANHQEEHPHVARIGQVDFFR